jgi:hypothetical protein
MTWSRTTKPSISAAPAMRLVSVMSSSLGVGSPDGWLWARTSAAAPSRSAGDLAEGDEAKAAVQERDEEALGVRTRDPAPEGLEQAAWRVEPLPSNERAGGEAGGQGDEGQQPVGAGRPDPADATEIRAAGPAQAPEALEAKQYLACGLQRCATRGTAAGEQEGEELGVAQDVGAFGLEAELKVAVHRSDAGATSVPVWGPWR